jgi:hypothetical protein
MRTAIVAALAAISIVSIGAAANATKWAYAPPANGSTCPASSVFQPTLLRARTKGTAAWLTGAAVEGRETFDRGNARIIRRTKVSTSPKSESLQSSGRVEYGVAAMQRRAPYSKGRASHSEIFSNGFHIAILEPESPAVPLLPVHPTHNEFVCIHVHPISPPNPRIAQEPLIVQAPYVAQDG